jgi:hypothetical protein
VLREEKTGWCLTTWSVGQYLDLRGMKCREAEEKHRNEELHTLSSSTNVKMIKSRTLRWVGHVESGTSYTQIISSLLITNKSFTRSFMPA